MKDVYEPLDKALHEINRYNLRAFDGLRLADWDELNIIRTVRTVYTGSTRQVRKRMRKACEDTFWFYLTLCNFDIDKALDMASGVITLEWIDDRMDEVDPTVRYRFTEETERKRNRLAESLTVEDGRSIEIDRALKQWTRQIGWFGIHAVDEAAMEAMLEADVQKVRWNTEQDGRQCEECDERHGQIYDIDKVPPKPHNGCRCWLTPVL